MKQKKNSISFITIVTFIFLKSIVFPDTAFAIGENKVDVGEIKTFHSKILAEDIHYFIHFPDDYSATSFRYPVMYLLNSQMISTFACGMATLDRVGGELTPKFLLVGISKNKKGR